MALNWLFILIRQNRPDIVQPPVSRFAPGAALAPPGNNMNQYNVRFNSTFLAL